MAECEACKSKLDVIDVGDEGQPEWLCKACIRENVEDFLGEPANDFDLAPFEATKEGTG